MKIKPIYQPWNEDDFRGDIFVQKMDAVPRWIYRSLLQAAYVCSTRPYLPSEDSKLWVLAGCDDEKTWQKYKDKVLPMFEIVEKNGVKYYSRKRVVDDWKRLQNIILTNKKNAKERWAKRKDATALRPHSDIGATPIQIKLNEVKINKEKLSLSQEEEMRKENYRVLCLKAGKKADPDNSGSWTELRDMCTAFGEEAVLSQFENWLSGKQTEDLRYPISLFVKVLPSLVQAPGLTKPDKELDNLAIELYNKSGSVFSGKALTALGELRTEFSDKEILQAWELFAESEQGSFLSNWPKKFTEGAARILIMAIRKENERRIQLEKDSEAEIERLRSEDAQRKAASEATAAQEALDMESLLRDLEN